MSGRRRCGRSRISGVWRALEEPRTLAELRTLFEAAFPDIEPRRIAGDLGALLERSNATGW